MKKKLNQAYYNGIREGIEQYAHWKDGVQYVGTCGFTLKDALDLVLLRAMHNMNQRHQLFLT